MPNSRFPTSRLQPELLVLTIASLITRFWGLFSPRAVVWDEIHYERFAGAYFTGDRYIDVHPPLGKLLMAGAAKLLGISGATLVNAEPAPLLRVLPALMGALIIPLVYLLLRELGSGRRTAAFGALLLLVDNAMLVESRLILPDIMLLFFGILVVYAYAVARGATGTARWVWIAGAAAAGGAAVSIKWTGLTALALIGFAWALEARRDGSWDWRRLAGEASLFALLPIAIYVGSFAVHFALLPHGRPNDPIMSDETRALLREHPVSFLREDESFAKSFVDLNWKMQAINVAWAADQHPSASKWYTWPIAKHSIGYWNERNADAGTERWIILFANPIVWWGALVGALATIVAFMRRAKALESRRAVLAVLGVGYVGNFLPFAFIQRPMFLYHYFFALIYSVLFATIGVGALAGWDGDEERFCEFPNVMSRRLYGGLAAGATILFLYLIPLTYGWPLSDAGLLHRRWILERHIGVSRDR
jgi:dolichyl-phosphate-mannose-protein mannosyltransferase